MQELKNKAIKSVFWVGGVKFLSQAFSWTVTILLIRLLDPEDYGLMGIALAYKLFLAIFFDFNIGEAILQKKELTERDTSTAFWIILVSSLCLYTITWNFSPALAGFFGNDALVNIIRVIGLSVIFMGIKEIPQRMMAREFEFKRRSLFELTATLLALATSLTLAFNDYGVWALLLGELIKDATLSLLIAWHVRWLPRLIFHFNSARNLLGFSIPVTGHYIFEFISNRSDTLIIGRSLGQDILGYYTVAMSVSRIPVNKGVQIIQQVMFPVFSKLQDDTAEFQRYFYQICYVISVMFFPLYFGMLAVSKEIVVVILSEKWLPSLFAFQVFSLLSVLLSYTGIFIVVLKSRAGTKAVFRYSLYSAILLPAGFLVGSRYGLQGIAISWAIIYPVLFSYLFYEVSREIGVQATTTLKKVSHALTGSTLMLFAVLLGKHLLFENNATVGSLLFGAAMGASVYVAYFWFFSRKTFTDVKTIWTGLRSNA